MARNALSSDALSGIGGLPVHLRATQFKIHAHEIEVRFYVKKLHCVAGCATLPGLSVQFRPMEMALQFARDEE
jgi:hypothetical protein